MAVTRGTQAGRKSQRPESWVLLAVALLFGCAVLYFCWVPAEVGFSRMVARVLGWHHGPPHPWDEVVSAIPAFLTASAAFFAAGLLRPRPRWALVTAGLGAAAVSLSFALGSLRVYNAFGYMIWLPYVARAAGATAGSSFGFILGWLLGAWFHDQHSHAPENRG